MKKISSLFIFLILIGIGPSIGIAETFPKVCKYTEIPKVIKSTGCGNAICYGVMECVSKSSKTFSVPISCVAKRKWAARFGTSGFFYECPNAATCYTMNVLASENKTDDELIKITSAINYIYNKSGEVVEGEVKIPEINNFPAGGSIIATPPPGGSIIATPPPSKREEPEDAGSTQ